MTDFFVAGSWRNRHAVSEVLAVLDEAGLTAYSFVRASYSGDAAAVAVPGGADRAELQEAGVRELFEQDLHALRQAHRFALVLPAGAAAHIEAGLAYGLGKPCLAVGPVVRSETLYRIFDHMFANVEELRRGLEVTASPTR